MIAQVAPRRFIRVETRAGEPISAQDKTITPLAISTTIQVPGLPVGLVWNRPSAVVVHYANGVEEVLPVQDVTRQALLTLFGAAAGVLLFSLAWKLVSAMIVRRKSNE